MSNVCEVYFPHVCSSQSFSSSFSHPFFLLLSLTTQWPSLYHHNQLIGQRLCLSPFILLDLYLYIGLCAWSFQSERICFFFAPNYFFFLSSLEVLSLITPKRIQVQSCTQSSRLPGMTK